MEISKAEIASAAAASAASTGTASGQGPELRGAEILVKALQAEKVKYVWGYPGGAVLHIYDAFYKQDTIQHVLVRHEQAAVHAADGYARASGRPGVAFVITGPGLTNTITAMGQARADSVPMLVISGVNSGINAADDVTYSGTIAGAMEGTALGIPSIALSQTYDFETGYHVSWSCAEAHGPGVVKGLVETGWPEDVLMNVNFPACEPGEVAGIAATCQGKRDMQTAKMERRMDLRNNPYFWIGFRRVKSHPVAGSDLAAIYEKRISVTPLHLNLTEHAVLERLRTTFDGG